MRVTTRVEVNLRTKEIAARGKGFAKEFALEFGEKVAEIARQNVAPGRGPGPHPHRTLHEDTGELMRSIEVKPESRGFLETARVFTDKPYGAHLEFGWTTRAGTHWRYPWLFPAYEEARHSVGSIVRSTARRWLSETGAPYRGRVNVSAPTTATFVSE